MLAVTAYPMLRAVWLSLYSYRLTDPEGREFVGLRNYGVILTDSLWWQDVFTTVLIMVVTVAAGLVVGMGFALAMQRMVVGRRFVRTAVLVPYGIITVVAAYAWRYTSPWTRALSTVGSGSARLPGSPSAGPRSSSSGWPRCEDKPFISLLLLAGLVQVPEELHEAARVDGATAWQRFRRVTLPNMRTAIAVALLFRALDAYRIFDSIFIMTGGAQNTESVSFLTYRQTITRTALGLGSALSVLLFLTVVLIAAAFIKGFRIDLARLAEVTDEVTPRRHRVDQRRGAHRRLHAAPVRMDRLALATRRGTTSTTSSSCRRDGRSTTTARCSTRPCSPVPCGTRC